MPIPERRCRPSWCPTTSHGSLTLNPDGSFAYTPQLNFIGTDTFTYTASDDETSSNPATVTITVNPVNDAPVAVADSYGATEDVPLVVNAPGVLANDTDIDGPSLSAALVTPAAHGTVVLNANGSFTYTPNANFNGVDGFTYRANDGSALSNPAAVTIAISPVNDPAVVNAGADQSITLPASATLAGVVTDDGAFTAVWGKISGPGTVTFGNANALSTTATFSVFGTYELSLTASDGQFVSSDNVVITVNPANAAVRFDGVNDYVTFGPAAGTAELGAATFTIETWFKREGPGVALSTGTGGLAAVIPLVTKGRGEAEGSNVDMNYFLGIDSKTRVLAADFEDTATGLNHPVLGTTTICDGLWYHAAATYDGTTWRLYLNGVLDDPARRGQLHAPIRQYPARGHRDGHDLRRRGRGLLPGHARRSADLERRAKRRRYPVHDGRTAGDAGRNRDRPMGAQRSHGHDDRRRLGPRQPRDAHERPDVGGRLAIRSHAAPGG